MKTASHTPTPWKTAEGSHGNYVSVVDSNGKTIARIPWGGNDGGNADMIVRAVNSHHTLVAALDRAKDHIVMGNARDRVFALKQAQDALSLANS